MGTIVYEIRGKIEILEAEVEYLDEQTNEYDISELSDKWYTILENHVQNDCTDLAEYIDEDDILCGKINSINIGIERKGSLAIVEAKQELNEKELKALENYIHGQYSDGWGEGFAQYPFHKYSKLIQFEGKEVEGEFELLPSYGYGDLFITKIK